MEHTHHFACQCREDYVASLEKQLADMLKVIDLLNQVVSIDTELLETKNAAAQ